MFILLLAYAAVPVAIGATTDFFYSWFHRIHHPVQDEHWNKNFGSFSGLWDIVFRHAHFPRKGDWPEVGQGYIDEPKTAGEFLLWPFQKNSRLSE